MPTGDDATTDSSERFIVGEKGGIVKRHFEMPPIHAIIPTVISELILSWEANLCIVQRWPWYSRY